MRIKVCGLTQSENAQAIAALGVDYLGHIYHPASLRHYTGNEPLLNPSIPHKSVGVFVNQTTENIHRMAAEWKLGIIQLHGEESPQQALELKALGFEVWKVLHLKNVVPNWQDFSDFISVTSCFLLDYKSPQKGGAGKKFNWDILGTYNLGHPLMLAGGIGPNDASAIKALFLKHSFLHGVDLNSQFETAPGIKNIALLQSFIQELQ